MESPNKENAMLLDMQYVKQNKQTGKPDYLYIIWKNLDTMEKHLQIVPEPKMKIYFEKEEFRDHTYNKNYAKLEELEEKVVKYKDIPFAIAEDAGPSGKRLLAQAFETKNYRLLKNIQLYPYVFGADYDAVAWYRIEWRRNLHNERTKKIKKGFLDIEVDGLEEKGMPNPMFSPINAVTLIDAYDKKVYTFLLTDREFKSNVSNHPSLVSEDDVKKDAIRKEMYEHMWKEQHELMEHTNEFISKLHDMFDESYGDLEYNIYFYTDEKKMLIHLFQLINKLKLDFIGIWNISFDIPYIMKRLEALGLNPADVMCHPDFPTKTCYFKADVRNHDIKNKSDFFYISSYTIFYDQMELYASIRKGNSELRSYRLNDIGSIEVRDTKLDYSESGDIKTLPYKNYELFVIYNIKDVLLQMGIEEKTFDVDTFYVSSYINATPYDKVFKKTVALRNVQYLSFLKQDLIPGANINIFEQEEVTYDDEKDDDDDDDDSFEGALVANPIYNGYVGLPLYGRPSNCIFGNAIDFDMSAFYPSSIRAMNIDPSTLIFKLIMDVDQFDTKISDGNLPFHGITDDHFAENEDVGKECIDNFQVGNYLSFAHKWLNFPSVSDVLKEIRG